MTSLEAQIWSGNGGEGGQEVGGIDHWFELHWFWGKRERLPWWLSVLVEEWLDGGCSSVLDQMGVEEKNLCK
jgi:hypothetical protein